MKSTKSIRTAVAAALIGCASTSHALTQIPVTDTIASADAYLLISNFTLLAGQTTVHESDTTYADVRAGLGLGPMDPIPPFLNEAPEDGQGNGDGQGGVPNILPLGPGGVRIDDVNSNGSVNTIFNQNAEATQVPPQGAGTAFSITVEQGTGEYEANETIGLGMQGSTSYTGGHSSTYGNALFPVPTPFSTSVAILNGWDGVDPAEEVNFIPDGSDAMIPANTGANCGAGNIGDCVHVHSQTNLVDSADGEATSNQGVTVEFFVEVQQGPGQWFELAFNAEGYLRAYLGSDDGNAFASHAWSVTVTHPELGNIFGWAPDGVVNDTDGASLGNCANTNFSGLLNQDMDVNPDNGDTFGRDCYEYADAFSLNKQVSANDAGDEDFEIDPTGRFEAELFLPSIAGEYTFTIAHTERTTGRLSVPEPTTVALMGAGLLGFAGARRRKAS